MATDPLLTQVQLGSLTLRNRIVSTSHEPSYSDDGLPKDRYRAYHVEKAKGGVALTMIGGSSIVSRESAPAFGNVQLWKDESVHWMRLLTDEVHEHGAAVMIQLSHMGHRSSNYAHEWIPAVSASAVREPAHRAFTKAAEPWDLDRILGDYVAAAQRCVAAGMDGVELMLHGHYLDSFITPFWNHRDDEYGGAYDNRMAYPLKVIRAIRKAVPEGFLIGARMSFDEDRERGLEVSELLTAAGDMVDAGVGFISALRGAIQSDYVLSRMIPVMGMPSAPHLEFIGEVKRKLDVPVMHAAKIADIPTARYAIEAGLLDMVGMTRAIIADPYLVRKMSHGQSDQIRPCVGASMCIDGIYTMGAAFCIHNPSTGRENELPQEVTPASRLLNVAVVGGGPAGLEAARVLAERGHKVTLFEANDRLGGQLAIAALAPRRRDLQGIIDWRAQELQRLGVAVRLSTYVDGDDLKDGGFDVVIVATGGLPAAPDITGANLAFDSWDVLSGNRRLSGEVLVYDDHGGTQALDVVEAAIRMGCTVSLVTPERTLAPDVGGLVFSGYHKSMADEGVVTQVGHHLTALRKEGNRVVATLQVEGSTRSVERTVDAVVAECGTQAVTDLYDELVPLSKNHGEVQINELLALEPQTAVHNPSGAFRLYRIGDAVAGRNVHAAMLDAARLCRAI